MGSFSETLIEVSGCIFPPGVEAGTINGCSPVPMGVSDVVAAFPSCSLKRRRCTARV